MTLEEFNTVLTDAAKKDAGLGELEIEAQLDMSDVTAEKSGLTLKKRANIVISIIRQTFYFILSSIAAHLYLFYSTCKTQSASPQKT